MFAIFSNNRKVQMCEVEVTGFKYVSEMGHFDRLYGIDKSICSEEVRTLATNTAGGHIRIRTNSHGNLFLQGKLLKQFIYLFFIIICFNAHFLLLPLYRLLYIQIIAFSILSFQ